MKTICSFCQEHLAGDPSDPVVSHGLCGPCFERELAALQQRLAALQRRQACRKAAELARRWQQADQARTGYPDKYRRG